MSPRPRTVSDEQILLATMKVAGKVGPRDLTLSKVARAAGLSPATIVQRFGSKRGLLLAMAKSAVAEEDPYLAEFRRTSASPLEALRRYLLCFAQLASSPREYANNLSFLHIDLTDPEFYRYLRKASGMQDKSVRTLVKEAMTGQQLARADVAEVTNLLLAVVGGSLMRWAVYRKGPSLKWLTRDVDAAITRLGK